MEKEIAFPSRVGYLLAYFQHTSGKLLSFTATYNQLTAFMTGAITSLSFVGALNAQQAQEITAAVKSLVQGYLCQSKQVNIESVNYNRNNGYGNT